MMGGARQRMTAEQEEAIAQGLLAGTSHREISASLGCAITTVGRVGQRQGVYEPRRTVPPRALNSAVERYEQGRTVDWIQRMTGVWPTTLYAELRRRGVPLRRRLRRVEGGGG
jgi:hypothetical protein